jgi:ABC-2 type transport system ATP-binding protein
VAENADTHVISVRGLTKVFRDFWRRPKVRAVDGLDLDVRRGEVFGLLGPNGSGKSTTLKILLGLLDPTAGSVSVLGRQPRHVQTKRAIGYLPEESYLYGYLTPRETLTFYGRLFPIDGAVIAARVEQLLDMTGLRAAAHRPVGEFSKGMARRVGLAQALINKPRLVLLDEPTSGLDPIGCRQVKDLIRSLARHGATVVLSSHLLADVEDVCDRIAILYNGRLRAMGGVRTLLEQQDRWRITLPVLSPEKTRALLADVRARAGHEPEIDRPAMNLERFFLQVVEDAAGAPPRAVGVAPYLEDAGES